MTDDQWITFKIGEAHYVHSVMAIKEIIPHSPPAPVPGAPQVTEGVLNVRGTVITIVSGRKLFNQTIEALEDSRIIILELKTGFIGISVDSVGSIIQFQQEQAEWQDHHELIRGTVNYEGQLHIIADFTEQSWSAEESDH